MVGKLFKARSWELQSNRKKTAHYLPKSNTKVDRNDGCQISKLWAPSKAEFGVMQFITEVIPESRSKGIEREIPKDPMKDPLLRLPWDTIRDSKLLGPPQTARLQTEAGSHRLGKGSGHKVASLKSHTWFHEFSGEIWSGQTRCDTEEQGPEARRQWGYAFQEPAENNCRPTVPGPATSLSKMKAK